jgi:hypothetical protein
LRFTFKEYLAVDAASPVKHEFLDGMIERVTDAETFAAVHEVAETAGR